MARTDVFVIGGGPAGLAAAIAARRAGYSVTVADGNRPPIDKACGEGLLPDSIAALESLGVRIPAEMGHPLRGIRFCCGEQSAQAEFPGAPGRGLRRLQLHDLLRKQAETVGVEMQWGTPARVTDSRWIIGADGATSLTRRRASLPVIEVTRRRYASRQHYEVEPWTDYVEIHWSRGSQVYITPVGEKEVGVALITSDPELKVQEALAGFPALVRRLGSAPVTSRMRGAVTGTTRLARVTAGNLALVGDASATVDAITGEGLGLAFRQAGALAEALKAGDLEAYERRHRALAFRPRTMARALLVLDRSPQLLRWTVRAFAARPRAFGRLLALHVGG